jgi:hypothetical protein
MSREFPVAKTVDLHKKALDVVTLIPNEFWRHHAEETVVKPQGTL